MLRLNPVKADLPLVSSSLYTKHETPERQHEPPTQRAEQTAMAIEALVAELLLHERPISLFYLQLS